MVKKNKKQKSTIKLDNLHKVENKFEQKINKKKHHVLGQKYVKGVQGLPTHSKSLSIKKRMETLLVEYKKQGKGNLFNDKRIGEKNINLSTDEKSLKRFKWTRKSHAQLFNLAEGEEEEELTHAGQRLSQIENFEDPDISDDDDEDDGKIAFEMQKEHFGGGKYETRDKSHADKMAELVLQSIISKNARRKEKNELLDDIEQINNSMKDILPKLNNQLTDKVGMIRSKPDSLDLKMKMLMFLPKGKPSDKLKSEEEKKLEEKEKFEKLENERLERMKAPNKKSAIGNHSVDDLYTNFETIQRNKISFKKEKFKSESKENNSNENDQNNTMSEDNEDDEDEDSKEGDDDSNEENDSNDGDDDSCDENDDDLSDVISIESTDENNLNQEIICNKGKQKNTNDEAVDFKDLKSYENFARLLKENKGKEILILDQLQNKFHKNITNEETQEFENMFDYLFKYIIEDLSDNNNLDFNLSQRLIKPLYKEMQKEAVHAGTVMACRLSEFQEEFIIKKNKNNGKSIFPEVKVLIYCKLVVSLLPASDFHHHVCSPTMLFISQLLNECRIENIYDVSYGLTLTSIFLEMVLLSKRFVPELVNFLTLTLFLLIDSKYETLFREKIHLKQVKDLSVLQLKSEFRDYKLTFPIGILQIVSKNINSKSNDELDKLKLSFLCLQMISKIVDLYSALPSFHEIFADIKQMLKLVIVHKYPAEIRDTIKSLLNKLSEKRKYTYLSFSASKPNPLKLFEPKIEAKIDDRKKLSGSRDFKVRQREIIKFKKLKKGTEREIRKDQRFLREHILADKILKNKEREDKTKKIISGLLVQEGEFKTLLKNKKIAGKKEKIAKYK